jgi:hypothetical protein
MKFLEKLKFQVDKYWSLVFKKLLKGTVLASLIISLILPAFLYPLPAQAQVFTADLVQWMKQALTTGAVTADTAADVARETARIAKEEVKDVQKNMVWAAVNEMFTFFLNTLAYDVATWVASGDEGQEPMFETEGWGKYLTNLADGMGGTFLETLGEADWMNGFNLCEPGSFDLKVSIGLGLARIDRPTEPDCTITDALKNWEELADDPNFLDKFDDIFDPYRNDIGISLKMFGKYIEAKDEERVLGILKRQEGQGAKPVTQLIADNIKTPAWMVRDEASWPIFYQGKDMELKVAPENLLLLPFTTFIDTLASKFLERIFKEGLVDSSGSSRSLSRVFSGFDQDLYRGESGSQSFVSKQAAELRFIDFLQAGISGGTPYDVLSKLSICADPDNPGPEECVIRPELRTAIERRLTLREAIDQGFIDGDAPFGFMDYDGSALYRGYSFRSIVILRTHRIIPVGWEIAAQAINNPDIFTGGTNNLNDLIANYENKDSVFYHLVDPNWVLKAPEHFCKAQGYGSKIVYDGIVAGNDENEDGDYDDEDDTPPERNISREEYCADFQSCIAEDYSGACRYYGYCTEERKTWDLQGSGCPDYFNTCQTFQASTGQLVSYLENSLDYNNCNIDNAGCQWYCQYYNPINNIWTCTNEDERVLKPCAQLTGCNLTASCEMAVEETFCSDDINGVNLVIGEPCHAGSKWWTGTSCRVETSCDGDNAVPYGGVACTTTGCEALPNLLPNPGFETGPTSTEIIASNWRWQNDEARAYFELVRGAGEKVYSGNNSIRFFSYGGPLAGGAIVTSDSFDLPAGDYTFYGHVYNQLNAGTITLSAYDLTNPNTPILLDSKGSTLKNDWQELSFDFSSPAGGAPIQVRITVAGSQVSGAAWGDNFRISEECITNPVTLTLVGTVDQDESKLHLDRDAQECSAEADGCSEFIRLKENLGTNIIPNSSFETWPNPNEPPKGWNGSGIDQNSNESATGNFSVALGGGDGIFVEDEEGGNVLAAMRPATTYYLSFWAKANIETEATEEDILRAGLSWDRPDASTNSGYFQLDDDASLDLTKDWRRFVMNATTTAFDGSDFSLTFRNIGTVSISLDGIQLEPVGLDGNYSDYKDYGTANLAYLKKPPPYLKCDPNGEVFDDECYNYALYCLEAEIGCETYAPVLGGVSIPAVVGYDDYCPLQCVGYDAYKQSTTVFERREPLEYFIPATALQCSASQAGCDEFTNLDEVAAGGEGREYYQYLRLCKRPTEAGADCQNFYTWQGSDETGYQLKVYNLSAETTGAPEEAMPYDPTAPEDLNWPTYWCEEKGDADGNNRPDCCDDPEDLETNPFCREFYALDGSIDYRIYANTISCSGDCHPLRKTRLGESDEEAEDNCDGSHGDWRDGACIYQAIPGEGIACSAPGCREYRGDAGGNIYTAFSESFEPGDKTGWRLGNVLMESLAVSGHSIESQLADGSQKVSTILGDLGGICSEASASYDPSLFGCEVADNITGETCWVDIGQQHCGVISDSLATNRTYLISFWAKSSSSLIEGIQTRLATTTGEFLIASANFNLEWNYYTFGPFIYQETTPDVQLEFVGPTGVGTNFYIDNIKIKEVQDYAYVIKNSWQTPEICDTNPWTEPSPTPAPQFMLGCKQYLDSYSRIHNLKSFNHLCREEAVGCEALIDTFNSTSPFAEAFNIGDEISEINISADKLVYLVNRPEYQCNSLAKGCQALGLPDINADEVVTGYQTTYLINDPDQYSSSLCAHPEVGCQEWLTNEGFAYFKDPGDRICEYKIIPGQTNYDWFKVGSTSVAPDCPRVRPPLGPVHPDNGFTGLCPGEFSTCTQFVDPTSEVAKNLVFNADFSQDIEPNNIPDGWNINYPGTGPSSPFLAQQRQLQHNILYTLSFVGKPGVREAPGQNLYFEIRNCPGITSFDYSMLKVCSGDRSTYCTANEDCAGVGSCDVLALSKEAYAEDTRNSGDIEGLPGDRQYSGRFFVPDDQICELMITLEGGNIDEIENLVKEVRIGETGLYYTLENSVDKLSCNGLVNPQAGCVLFNDRSRVNYKIGEDDISYLVFDADVSGSKVNGGLAVFNCSGNCDSNAILKVRPDRVCQAWLNCTSYATFTDAQGAEKKHCTSIGLCNSLDEAGNCKAPVPLNRGDDRKTYYTDKEEIENLSGYSKPGFDFDGDDVDDLAGYFPYAEMTQEGGLASSPSTNFETAFTNTVRPYGWQLECPLLTEPFAPEFKKREWRTEYARVINNPVSAQREGLDSAAPEGSNFVKVNGPYVISSEEIEVFSNTEYVLSGYINTLRLLEGKALLQVQEYNDQGVPVDSSGNETPNVSDSISRVVEMGALNDWTFEVAKFETSQNTTRMRIILNNENPIGEIGVNPCTNESNVEIQDIVGASYFDDIKIKPSLQVTADTYLPSDCRIYPASDSLSCDYYTDDNFRLRGWLGYCVERDPANKDQCLVWWPVDLIAGGFVTEQPLLTRAPLYYCYEAKENYYEIRKCMFADPQLCASIHHSVGGHNIGRRRVGAQGWPVPEKWQYKKWEVKSIKVATSWSHCGHSHCGGHHSWGEATFSGDIYGGNWLPGTNNLQIRPIWSDDERLIRVDVQSVGDMCLCPDMDIIIKVRDPWCKYVVQTVTPFGQNKAWWSRISEEGGQLYLVPNLGYHYSFDYSPYGSLVPPTPIDNPAEWDAKDGQDGVQPLAVEPPNTEEFTDPYQARAGAPYSCSSATVAFTGTQCTYPDQTYFPWGKIPTLNIDGALVKLKRLFARSYGIWKFRSVGICIDDNTGEPDDPPIPCACPNSRCRQEGNSVYQCHAPRYCVISGTLCTQHSDCPAEGDYCEEAEIVQSCDSLTENGCGSGTCQQKACPNGVGDCHIYDDTDGDGIPETYIGTTGPCEEGVCGTSHFRCVNSPGDRNGKHCCPDESTCTEIQIGLCNKGPFEGLLCSARVWPNGDNCPSGYSCEGQINEEAYILLTPNEAANEELAWIEPTNLCANNNQRPEPFCDGGGDLNGLPCSFDNPGCGTGVCRDRITGNPTGDDYCAVAPRIPLIEIGPLLEIYGGETVELNFTSQIDPEQLPLVGFEVDWGDGVKTSISGQALISKPDEENPFVSSHLYSFWDLQMADRTGDLRCNTPPCCTENECRVTPRVQIRDNWGWCNGNIDFSLDSPQPAVLGTPWGYHGSDCGTTDNAWQPFAGEIIVHPQEFYY